MIKVFKKNYFVIFFIFSFCNNEYEKRGKINVKNAEQLKSGISVKDMLNMMGRPDTSYIYKDTLTFVYPSNNVDFESILIYSKKDTVVEVHIPYN